MKITIFQQMPFEMEVVWRALIDPTLLRQSIPGCGSLRCVDHARWAGDFSMKLGSQNVTLRGNAKIVSACPPENYSLRFSIGHPFMGDIRGRVEGRLTDDGEKPGMSTIVQYDLEMRMGGQFSAAPAYFVETTVRKLADGFFTQLMRGIARQEGGHNKKAMALFAGLFRHAEKNTVS